jgi:ubiquinone/menaquinone biosynthesis C-methylase UbiE
MDQYTSNTKIWLDERFKSCDEQGIYFAHQPIYGFRSGHSEPGLIDKYIRTCRIMKTLSHIKFDSLLDAGAAEGYKAYITHKLFDATVHCCDLSEEACRRAEEIFHLNATPADINDLPFKDCEFDVVLCSETLEHVANLNQSINELLRVAGKALIITVPHESDEVVEKNIAEEITHGHIHRFDIESFNFLKSEGYHIIVKKIGSPFLRIHDDLVEATPKRNFEKSRFRKLFEIYNLCMPISKKLFGKKSVAFLNWLDEIICNCTPYYSAILFIILKDDQCFTNKRNSKISACQVINTEVPLYYLKKQI